MKEYVDAGKVLASQYNQVCRYIVTVTDRVARECEALYELAYKARSEDLPDKNKQKSSPVENAVVLIEKMRNSIDEKYSYEIAEYEKKKLDIEGIIQSAGLTADESYVFYLRYGMHKKMLCLHEIADIAYYSERSVKRILDRAFEKVGRVV